MYQRSELGESAKQQGSLPAREPALIDVFISDHRERLFCLADAVLEAHRETPFSSIVSDDLSGRLVARFIRDILKPEVSLKIYGAWPEKINGTSVREGGITPEQLLRYDLGGRPLLVTEAIYTGKACEELTRKISSLTGSVTVATMLVTDDRGISSRQALSEIRASGASKVLIGGSARIVDQMSIKNANKASGMFIRKGSERSSKRSWLDATEEDGPGLKEALRREGKLAREALKELAYSYHRERA